MRILHILNTGTFSGAENVVCQIISLFRDDPDIQMAYCSRDGQIRSALEERDIDFYPIASMKVAEIKRVISEFKPDIIHAHDMRATLFAALACGRIPLVSHVHGNAEDASRLGTKSLLFWLASFRTKKIFWVSKSALEGFAFSSAVRPKSEILYNIIDKDALIKRAEKDRNDYNYDVVYLGRLTYAKDPERLMEVCRKIVDRKHDIRIAVIGSGELEASVKSRAEELKLIENVTFLGFMSNPLGCLKSAGLMLMTSRFEGTPMCVLEAMALGVPVVSTPTDGIADLITKDCGFLSENDDELADAVVRIVSDTETRSDMSKHIVVRFDELCDRDEYRRRIRETYEAYSFSNLSECSGRR